MRQRLVFFTQAQLGSEPHEASLPLRFRHSSLSMRRTDALFFEFLRDFFFDFFDFFGDFFFDFPDFFGDFFFDFPDFFDFPELFAYDFFPE